jgi:hypothetical protein
VDNVDSEVTTAAELVHFARCRGVDLSPYYKDGKALFLNRGRGIFFWKKEGKIGYWLQGPITLLPFEFKNSADSFHGGWNETGLLPNLERALELFIAWIVDFKEVDELPDAGRERDRRMIG